MDVVNGWYGVDADAFEGLCDHDVELVERAGVEPDLIASVDGPCLEEVHLVEVLVQLGPNFPERDSVLVMQVELVQQKRLGLPALFFSEKHGHFRIAV